MIELPWPPSVNRYWRNVGGRAILSKEARDYRQTLEGLALCHRWPKLGGRRVSVEIEACPPDRRRRDLDNVLKAVLDGLTHVGVWHDDSQIDRLTIRRGALGGICRVDVAALPVTDATSEG